MRAADDPRRRPAAPRAGGAATGFTLVELAIVTAMLTILASLVTVQYRRGVLTAREMVATEEIRDLQEEIELYEHGQGGLPAALTDLGHGPRIDPWGNPYQYLDFATLPSAGGGGGGSGGGSGGGGSSGGGSSGGGSGAGGSGGGGKGGGAAGGGGGSGGAGGGATGGGGSGGGGNGGKRKDRFIVPLNSTFDLYSMGPEGESVAPLTAKASRDDVIRANDGEFVGPARNY